MHIACQARIRVRLGQVGDAGGLAQGLGPGLLEDGGQHPVQEGAGQEAVAGGKPETGPLEGGQGVRQGAQQDQVGDSPGHGHIEHPHLLRHGPVGGLAGDGAVVEVF